MLSTVLTRVFQVRTVLVYVNVLQTKQVSSKIISIFRKNSKIGLSIRLPFFQITRPPNLRVSGVYICMGGGMLYVTEERVRTLLLPIGLLICFIKLKISRIESQGSMCTALASLIENYRHNI